MPKKKSADGKKTTVPPAKAVEVFQLLKSSGWKFTQETIQTKTINVGGKAKKLFPKLREECLGFFEDKATQDSINKAFDSIKFGGKKTAKRKEDYIGEFKPEGVNTSPAGTLTIPVAAFFGRTRSKSDTGTSTFPKFQCSVVYGKDGSITIKEKK